MKIKTNELIGPALDWLASKCNGDFALYHDIEEGHRFLNLWTDSAFLHYSSNWAQGGVILEREEIGFAKYGPNGTWKAVIGEIPRGIPCYGPTPLIAAMRCYCCAKLGEEIDIPQALQPCQQPNL